MARNAKFLSLYENFSLRLQATFAISLKPNKNEDHSNNN